MSHGIIHCIELEPVGLQPAEPRGDWGTFDGFDIEGWPRKAPGGGETGPRRPAWSSEKPPLVLLPGFGMGAASFAGCIEHLLAAFPERRAFLLDWPSSGAAPRMPWTLSARDRLHRGGCCRRRAAPGHTGAHAVPQEEPDAPAQRGHVQVSTSHGDCVYPLPEERFVALIEQWREALGIPTMVLVGHSIGGYIAFNYADAHRAHVDRLLLCSPCGLPRRPDALGVSEAQFSEWMEIQAAEEPEYANEFMKGSAVKRPRLTCCDYLCIGTCVPLLPLLLPVIVVAWCYMRRCRRRRLYEEVFPHSGVAQNFRAEWPMLTDLPEADRARLYEHLATPPQAYARLFPACLARRGMQMFTEVRLADNGQWAESEAPEPTGPRCEVLVGADGLAIPLDAGGTCLAAAKLPRGLFAEYLYCSTTFGDADFNWGEQLFQAVQFPMGYRSFGWARRPIGRRVERFVGLPENFEGSSEYYRLPAGGKPAEGAAPGRTEVDAVPVAFFYGQSDWMPFHAARLISEKVARHSGRAVPVLLLKHSGHQMFIDDPGGFVRGLRALIPK